VAPRASSWLSVAGSGDVLAGTVASRLATTRVQCGPRMKGCGCMAPPLCCRPRPDSGDQPMRSARPCRRRWHEHRHHDRLRCRQNEGATADGRYVALSAPGDVLEADGTLTWGPNHVEPPCRHFPACGGCQLQHLSEAALR
jgi:hypothetical protein